MSILSEADALINGQRQTDYGHPARNFADVAKMWTAYLLMAQREELGAKDVANMMSLLKMCRVANGGGNIRDGLVDQVGYLACIERIDDYHAEEANHGHE